MNLYDKNPMIGVGVLIRKNDSLLLGKRKEGCGAGCFAFPGGALEYGEELENCARREVYEETQMELNKLEFMCIVNFILSDQHYIDFIYESTSNSLIAKCMEKDKAEGWDWYTFDNLPTPIFIPTKEAINKYVSPNKNIIIDLASRYR